MKLVFLFCMLFVFSLTAQRLCFIGDGGNGSSDQLMVAKALEKELCHSVLYTGDVVYEDGIKSSTDSNFFSKFYNPYLTLMNSKIKFYMSMGNHDWNGSVKSWIDISKKYDYISFPNYYFVKTIENNICFISLETNKSSYFKSQTSWWNSVKQTTTWKNCKFTFGFGHVPYLSSGGHGNASGEVKSFLEKFVGTLDLYVAGHDHNLSDEGDVNGTRLLVSGCAGKKSDLNSKPKVWGIGNKVGYLVVDVAGSSASYKFVTVTNGVSNIEHNGTIQGKVR